MKVSNHRPRKKFQTTKMTNHSNTFKILCIYWKIIGVCPLGFNCNGTFTCNRRQTCYAIFLILFFGNLIIYSTWSELSCIPSNETLVSVTFGILCTVLEYGVIFSAWFNIGLRQNLLRRLMETSKGVRVLINDLQVPLDVENRIIRDVNTCVFLVNITWFCFFSIFTYFAYHFSDRCIVLKTHLLANIPRLVTHNVVLAFVFAVNLVRASFVKLNASARRNSQRTRIATRMYDEEDIFCDICSESNEPDLLKFGSIHDDLNTLVKMFANLFSMPIMLNLIVNYLQISTSLYIFCVLIYNKNITTWESVGTFIHRFSWLSVHVGELLLTIGVCELVTLEANRSANILHRIFLSDQSDDYAQQIKISLRLLQQPMQVEIHGLRISSALLLTIFGSITTYLVVMMQLDEQARGRSTNYTNWIP